MAETPTTWRYTDTREYMDAVRGGLPPMMICVACNGGVQGKEYNPGLPETPEEIADSVHEAWQAGASMVHVHARSKSNPTAGATTAEEWWKVNRRIRERCPDIIINNTTGGDYDMTMDQRLACLEARPEVASLNLTPDMVRFRLKARQSPLPFPREEREIDGCLPFTYGLVETFAKHIRDRGVLPEIEIYHPGAHWVIDELRRKELLRPPFLIQTVMGVQTTSYPTPQYLLNLMADMPKESVWLCSGIGPYQMNMVTMAIMMGGHARVGLEDNVYYRRGELLKSNAQAVQRVARLAGELNRDIATAAQVRKMLGLGEPSRYD